MPGWAVVTLAVLGFWLTIGFAFAVAFGRAVTRFDEVDEALGVEEGPTVRRAPQRAAIVPAAASSARTTRRRILLVDDDPGLRLLLRATLGAGV
jgi:hypothetical protein